METLPHWDLGSIYPSVTSKEFETDLQAVKAMVPILRTHLADAGAQKRSLKSWVQEAIRQYQLIWDTLETLGSFANALLTVNTSDETAMRGMNQVEEVSLDAQAIHVEFLNILAANDAAIRALFVSDTDLKPLQFAITELLDLQRHQMSEAEEALAADLNRSGADSWGRLQEAVSSSAGSVWDETTGERKTVIQLRSLAFDQDRSIRQRAFEKELAVWKLHEVSFAYAINGVKGATITLDKRRGYRDPLDRSVQQARITDEVLQALIGAIETNLPTFRKYLRAKAHALGVPKLAFYDLFAPVGTSAKEYSYAQAREFIVRNFSDFHKPLGDFAEHAFEHNWIDSESRAGKIGGAYCTSFPLRKETRVLANFDHSFDGVSTIAHELGHAYHDKVTCGLLALLRHYPMTLAETASIFAQYIIFQGALQNADDQQRLALIENFLQDSTQVCVDILSRYYFEKELFTRRAKGDLMPSELSAMMVEAQKRSYGDALDENQLHPWMWAVKSHYYRSGLSFYNFPYAFGQLFGLGVYKLSQQDPEHFGERYDQLLLLTGQNSAPVVTASVGCDITTLAFWQEGIDLIGSYVDEFCALCGYKE